LRFARPELLSVRLGLGLAAAALVTVGCSASSGPSAGGSPAGGSSSRTSSSTMVKPETPSTVRHWGSFFGGTQGNFDIEKSPVSVTVPGTVAEVGTSNSTEYALLTNGSLWAWGNDRAAQPGDATTTMKALPVRFHAPAGVVYRSLATGSATSYAISTTGDVYAWGVGHVGQVGDARTRTAVTSVMVATGAASISATANNVLISVPRKMRP
jgi:hypothetical protein